MALCRGGGGDSLDSLETTHATRALKLENEAGQSTKRIVGINVTESRECTSWVQEELDRGRECQASAYGELLGRWELRSAAPIPRPRGEPTYPRAVK